ncbi:MAG: hypothetical protein ACXV5Q_15300 [Frankiaceae bacterium]
MRIGIHYDTGFFPAGRSSREVFDPEQAAFDINAIAHDLHCDAVRVSGGDLARLSAAAEFAAAAGLEVWFSPMPCELDTNQMLAFFGECAGRAAALRRSSAREVVLVLGCEVSVFGRGFLPGADAYARLRELSAPSPELVAEYPALLARLNAFLSSAAGRARARFAGPVTYAAGSGKTSTGRRSISSASTRTATRATPPPWATCSMRGSPTASPSWSPSSGAAPTAGRPLAPRAARPAGGRAAVWRFRR